MKRAFIQLGSGAARRFALSIALCVCAAAHAAPESPTAEALRDLDSNSVEVRERGAVALRSWAGSSPDRYLTLITPRSSPEQRERLLLLAREAFELSPRGALGVSFGFVRQFVPQFPDQQYEEGIPIQGTLEGFDSTNVLKGGDLLRAIDGNRVRNNIECQTETVSRDKGQSVQLDIEREGRPLRVTVILGSRRELRGAETPSSDVMAAAWKLRLARVAGPQDNEAPIGAVPPLAWAEADRLAREPVDPEAAIRLASVQQQDLQIERIMPDGSRVATRREGTPPADLVTSGAPREKVASGRPQAGMLTGEQQFVNVPIENRAALIQRVERLRDESRLVQSRIDQVRRDIADPNLPRDRRQLLRQILDELEIEKATVQAQLMQLERLRRNR